MQEELLPLFPLQVVLFPRTALPLHIFEERYKQMIADVQRGHTEFGVVLAGEKGIVNTGCTATVEKVLKKYPDGRMDLISLGRRRFEIILLNDEKPYLRGAVEYFDDEATDPIPPEVNKRVIDSYNDLRALDDSEPVHEPRTQRSTAQLPTGASRSRPGLSPDSAGHPIGSRPDAASGRVLPQLQFPPAPDSARARSGPTNGHAKGTMGV